MLFFSAVQTQCGDLKAIKVNCFQIFDRKWDKLSLNECTIAQSCHY